MESDRPSGTPFVGLRPYTPDERHLLFGRDRDALLLRNKILSAPLTVLYAMSGVGKSSLLRALVEPMLEEQDAHVVHFDRWVDPDPVQAVKLAVRTSIPISQRSAPAAGSLGEIVRSGSAARGAPAVLILDQFEELLLRRPEAVEALGAELGALVRAESNAHVVLSLREEFIASLDVLRMQIVTLFSSTYRLRPLDEAGVREAIERPAELCGGSVGPGLADALLRDLRANPEERQQLGPAAPPGDVELPFLQLVCLRLWEAAEAHGHQLSLDQYERLGGRKGIIEGYVRELTEAFPRAQRAQLARLLNLLAPRSGVKMAFEAGVLADVAKVPADHLTDLLGPLAKSFVVRIRTTRTAKWYELYHDAFIRVVREWVDGQLRLASWRRMRGNVAAAAAGAFVLGAAMFWLLQWQRGAIAEREHTSGPIRSLMAMSPAGQRTQTTTIVDDVTHWLLAKAEGDSSGKPMRTLMALLEQARGPIDRYYGREQEWERSFSPGLTPGRQEAGPAAAGTGTGAQVAPVTFDLCPSAARGDRVRAAGCATGRSVIEIRYGDSIPLRGAGLADAWRDAAQFLADSLGLPPPMRLVVARDSGVPENLRVRLRGVTLNLSWLADSTLVNEQRLGDVARGQFAILTGAHRIAAPTPGGQWWVVPKWTTPLWRGAGHPRMSLEQLVALAALTALTDDPTLLLTPTVTLRLLASAGAARPRGASGSVDSVSRVLAAVARSGHSIRGLDGLLRAMADDTGGPRDSLPVRVWNRAIEASCRVPRPGDLAPPTPVAERTSRDAAEVLAALPTGTDALLRRRVRLQLCLLSDYLAERRIAAADKLVASLRDGQDTLWTARERYALGYLLMNRAAAGPVTDSSAMPLRDLEAAFRWMPEQAADSAYPDLELLCQYRWATRYCWAMLDTLVRARPASFWLPLLYGYDAASNRTGRSEVSSALELLRGAEDRLPSRPESDRSRLRAWVGVARARAFRTLFGYEPTYRDSLSAGAADLAKLLAVGRLGEPGWPDEVVVRSDLINARVLLDQWTAAESTLAAAGALSSLRQPLVSWKFMLQLAQGRLDSALAFSDRASADTTVSTLFTAALARILSDRSDADTVARLFYATQHEYVDYIRMLQFWRVAARDTLAARALIEQRWAGIDSLSWPTRLRAGDKSVWREMLIGYYATRDAAARQRARDALLGPLDDAGRFAGSVYQYLGYSLRGLRCEGYFYDALLQSVTGLPQTRRERAADSFRKAIGARVLDYYEYHMARLLLRRYSPANLD